MPFMLLIVLIISLFLSDILSDSDEVKFFSLERCAVACKTKNKCPKSHSDVTLKPFRKNPKYIYVCMIMVFVLTVYNR